MSFEGLRAEGLVKRYGRREVVRSITNLHMRPVQDTGQFARFADQQVTVPEVVMTHTQLIQLHPII